MFLLDLHLNTKSQMSVRLTRCIYPSHVALKEKKFEAGIPFRPRVGTPPQPALLCSFCRLSQWPCYLCHTFLSYVETGKTGLSLSCLHCPLCLYQPGGCGHQVMTIQWQMRHIERKGIENKQFNESE